MDGVGNSTNEHTETQVGANMTGAEPHPNSQQAEQTAATEPVLTNELRQRRRIAGADLDTATATATATNAPEGETSEALETATGHTTAREETAKENNNNIRDSTMFNENSGNGGSGANEFSCNICFDTATDPVLTICGHLFCWSCLVQWLERSATCPVCKAGCDKDKVIPVYGRGRDEKDPRLNPNMPNRPAGQRPPPPPPRQPSQFFGFDPFGVPGSFHSMGMARTRVGGGGGTVFVGGLGLLPALMGFSTFSGGTAPSNAAPGTAGGSTQPAGQQSFALRVFMMVAAMILMSIIFY